MPDATTDAGALLRWARLRIPPELLQQYHEPFSVRAAGSKRMHACRACMQGMHAGRGEDAGSGAAGATSCPPTCLLPSPPALPKITEGEKAETLRRLEVYESEEAYARRMKVKEVGAGGGAQAGACARVKRMAWLGMPVSVASRPSC